MSAKEFSALFEGYTRAHGIFVITGMKRSDKVGGDAKTTIEPLTLSDWSRHLNGESPGLGIIPLRDDGETVKWAAIDIDDSKIDHVALEKRIAGEKIPAVVTKSKSGGAHVWLFFAEPISAKIVRAKVREIASCLGHGGAEIFPKQDERISKKDFGNWINLPYFGKTRAAVIAGKEATLEQFLAAAKKRIVKNSKALVEIPTGLRGDDFADGPPCLQILAFNGIQEGTRNDVLYNVALYLKTKNSDHYHEDLLAYNKTMDQPLSSGEIQKIAESAGRADYPYTCRREPLCSHCNKAECMKRDYGIGKFDGVPLQGVHVGEITVYKTTPEVFIVELNDARLQLPGGVETFATQAKMRRLCITEFNDYPPQVARKTWDDFVRDLSARITYVNVPDDASPVGLFMEYFREFLSRRTHADKEKIATGNVWRGDDGLHYFRLIDLLNYLSREGFNDLSRANVIAALKESGAESDAMKIKGRNFAVWKIDAGALQNEAFDVDDFGDPF